MSGHAEHSAVFSFRCLSVRMRVSVCVSLCISRKKILESCRDLGRDDLVRLVYDNIF